jgi:hypothetical protein
MQVRFFLIGSPAAALSVCPAVTRRVGGQAVPANDQTLEATDRQPQDQPTAVLWRSDSSQWSVVSGQFGGRSCGGPATRIATQPKLPLDKPTGVLKYQHG